ncbi:MAG: hypothetical protein JST84_22610 [Acidobacteria bacterium]|nr:hypothetical protein [Acidobacteriota bacterium]
MKMLNCSLLASFAVQLALPVIYLGATCLPAGSEQSVVFLLFPFVAGIPLGPMLLRPLAGFFSPEISLHLAIVSAFVGNFIVYAMIFQGWFFLRSKMYTRQKLTVSM